MRIVELDAGSWTTPRDVLRALHEAIGTPDMQDWNIDILIDAIVGNAHPPYTIRISGIAKADANIKANVKALASTLRDVRRWRRNHRYDDVGVAIEIVS
jgi:RNAse (barnase) inhibitor barstar